MASVRNLKKDINYVLGDIIEAVFIWEATAKGKPTPESDSLVEEAIVKFDNLIKKVNQKGVENKKKHFAEIQKELEEAAGQLVAKVNALA